MRKTAYGRRSEHVACIRTLYYGWYDPKAKEYRLSRYPADAPVRPSIRFEKLAEVDAMIERKRARIMWWPPLPDERVRA